MSGGRGLTIGIDARAAAEVPAGRGRVVRELLRALAAREEDHRYILYTRREWREVALDERFRWREIGAGEPLWHLLAAREANRRCDVFLSCNSYLTAWFLRIPCVPIVYDLVAFETGMHPNRRSALIERATLGVAVRRSRAFIAISQATADALAARYPSTAGRTTVAPLAASPTLRPGGSAQPVALPAPGFVLAVGTLEPRKNLPRLVEAYRALDEELQDRHPLVVVGALGWRTGETLTALQSLGRRCTMLGFVSDGELAELYERCAVFCYPSLGEGFGLPVLEAMGAGAAVLTSNVSSLPEVGGQAVAYADPASVEDIAAELGSLLADGPRRATLAALARERAREFSWDRFAGRVLSTLQEAARGV
ncbi:MAG TPA: glycosyltransferase family 1 protein [Solirubrobacteraceae bacterium]|nr:glycosyltransferase family 1 protein [Solirubrobacteraceae bacterium]